MNTNEYYDNDGGDYFNKPSLILRVKSTLIDSVVIIILMYLASIVLNSLGVQSGGIRGMVLIFIFLYEPILVTLSRTIGQKIMGLRVRKFGEYVNANSNVNINIVESLLRYIGKIMLGWISLLTIHSDKYGRAIHDKLGRSLMTIE